MEFFTEKDFEGSGISHTATAAAIANDKLEREAKIVYTHCLERTWRQIPWDHEKQRGVIFKALLINIEPVERCKHPKEKVTTNLEYGFEWTHICICGAKVQPSIFEEIK